MRVGNLPNVEDQKTSGLQSDDSSVHFIYTEASNEKESNIFSHSRHRL